MHTYLFTLLLLKGWLQTRRHQAVKALIILFIVDIKARLHYGTRVTHWLMRGVPTTVHFKTS